MTRLSLVALLVIAIPSFSTAKQGFILVGPKVYDKGSTETLSLTLFDVRQSGEVYIRLLNSSGEGVISEVNVKVENGQAKAVRLLVPPEISSYDGKLEIGGLIGDYRLNKTVNIRFRDSKTIVFVSTDKPIYKAEQTVRIRVLATDSNLRPPDDQETEVQIWVTDPNRIRIAQWLNVSLNQGLIHREIPLPEEPVLGTWMIHVILNNIKHVRTFQVLEYVLPPFEVKVTPPAYVYQNDDFATWKICAKYTYGKPVKGRLLTKLSLTRQYWQKEYQVIENDTEINGCTDLTLPVGDLINRHGYYSYRALELQAEVTEHGTGTQINSTGSVRPVNYKYTITRQDSNIQYFRPRIPLKMTMAVNTPDSKPLPNESIQVCINMIRKISTSMRSITDTVKTCKNYTSNDHGLVIFTIPPQDDSTVYINVEAEAAVFDSNQKDQPMNRPKMNFRLNPWYSPSGNHLQLEKLPKIDCSAFGSDVTITQPFYYTFNKSENATIHYQVMARGEMVKTGYFNIELNADNSAISKDDTYLPQQPSHICNADGSEWDNDIKSSLYTGQFIHSMELSHDMIPKARLLMYTVTTDGDVTADSTWYDVDPCFANKVEMKFSDEKQSPGAKTAIHITAEPQSLCSINIVDKSVYILNKGDILTGSQVSDRLRSLDTSSQTPPYQPTPDYVYCQKKDERTGHVYGTTDYVDAITAFSSAGSIVLTDLDLETRPCKQNSDSSECYSTPPQPYPTRVAFRPIAATTLAKRPAVALSGVADRNSLAGGSQTADSAVVTVRTDFPETWLFQLDKIGKNGELILKQDLPDSITEWKGAAICIHPEKGLGLSEPASIIAFQPFFASLTLPYSVIRNETVPVIVTIFNYLKDCLPIKIHLDGTEDFVLYNGTLTRDICVCGDQSTTIRFHIKPRKLGQLNITVAAAVSKDEDVCENFDIATDVQRSDTITKSMLVEAEGFLKEHTTNTFFCLKDTEEGLFKADDLLQVPTNVVEDSFRAYCFVTGDLMGPTLEGLDRLVRMPTGCGEQNMIGLVPNIVVLKYLNATGRLTEQLKEKAVKNIRHGYVRQQKYIHPDGSYSAFGTRDKEGSIWLTAFVVKTFVNARFYIDIDEEGLRKSYDWISSYQNDNGCFRMIGTVHHQAMKGGVSKDDGTASTLTAYILVSMLESGSADKSVIEAGLRCIDAKSKPNNYSLALFAYAASLADDLSASRYLKELIDNAEEENGNTYWKNEDKSIAIETASYVILALLKLNRLGDLQLAATIVRWLTMQRNPYGGFHSTQDTVIGLQALGEYGARINSEPLNMELSINTDRIYKLFQLNEENELLMQRINLKLENEPLTTVKIEASGTGCALVQTLLRYNLPSPEPRKDFELSVETAKSKEDCKKAAVRICASYNHGNGSNMAIVEVKMVSGYSPVKSTVEELLQKTKLEMRRYEIKENSVNLYFTTLTQKASCFSFDVTQEIEVLDAKPSSAKVYDYYDNEKEVSVPYAIEEACS